MTLRKFHLLQAEWVLEQKLQDIRTYKLLCALSSKAPPPEEVFPTLAANESAQELDEDLEDDEVVFQQVAAALHVR